MDKLLGRMEEAILLSTHRRLALTAGAVGDVLGFASAQLSGRKLGDLFPPNTSLGQMLAEAWVHQEQLKNVAVGWNGNNGDRRLLINLEFSPDDNNPNLATAILRARDAAGHHELEAQLGTSLRHDAINRVTGSVAHEIKNPLNSIAIRLDNIRAWATAKFPEAEKEILNIFEEVNRLDRVVRTFLDFTRPVTLSKQKLDVVALAAHVAEMLNPDAARRNVRMRFNGDTKSVFVQGDRDLLQQAIINIVSNAIEAMPNGGSLNIEVVQSGGECAIVVSDTGVGIPEEVRENCLICISPPSKMARGSAFLWRFKPFNCMEEPSTSPVNRDRGTFHVRLPLIAENGWRNKQ